MLESIAITTPPTKTAYVAGETFDPSGMVVTATYSDESAAAVAGYSVSPAAALTVSDATVTVSYAEDGVTKTATVSVTVAVRMISYAGQSKVIRGLCELVSGLCAAFDATDAQIEQALSNAWDAVFEEGWSS